MNTSFRETAIGSLRDLEDYYQSRYEQYLAMATEASEHRERVRSLMFDLSKDLADPESKSLGSQDPETVSALYEVNELPQSESSLKSELIEDEIEVEDNSAQFQSLQLKQLLKNLSTAIAAIEFASRLDSGKSLHKSYLREILNRELSQKLSEEMVDLYLDEAINRGLIECDEFNNQCYVATFSSDLTNGLAQRNGHNRASEKQQVLQPKKAKENQADKKLHNHNSSSVANKHRNLPPSSKLKPTLLVTVKQYIAECNPHYFSAKDIINYLYSSAQQAKWSQNNSRKVRVSIFNVLSRKAYLDKYWQRVDPGVYQPLNEYDEDW